MKKFLEAVVEWKTAACYMFTGSTVVYMLIMFTLGKQEVEILSLLSLLIISAFGTFFQFLAFTDRIIKKLRYSLRMVIFVIPFFVLLSVCALIFKWFPANMLSAWLLFGVIFIIVFIGMVIGFEIYFRITGKKYDGLLGQYRLKEEKDR